MQSKSNNNIFWSVYKKLLNNKKQTNIYPLLENNSFVTNFLEKATIFNNYFADICRPIDNGSILPALPNNTVHSLSDVTFSENAIVKVISKLNVNMGLTRCQLLC